jgi:hypothetical protein
MLREKFHTIGGELINFDNVNFNASQTEVEIAYGWEACMYWSTFYYTELTF